MIIATDRRWGHLVAWSDEKNKQQMADYSSDESDGGFPSLPPNVMLNVQLRADEEEGESSYKVVSDLTTEEDLRPRIVTKDGSSSDSTDSDDDDHHHGVGSSKLTKNKGRPKKAKEAVAQPEVSYVIMNTLCCYKRPFLLAIDSPLLNSLRHFLLCFAICSIFLAACIIRAAIPGDSLAAGGFCLKKTRFLEK